MKEKIKKCLCNIPYCAKWVNGDRHHFQPIAVMLLSKYAQSRTSRHRESSLSYYQPHDYASAGFQHRQRIRTL